MVVVLVILLATGVVVMAETSGSVVSRLGSWLGIEEAWGKGKHELLTTIAWCIVGVVSIWLALSADKRASAMDATANAQALTAKNAEAGLRQDRMKNAIEHLGHSSESVRMGGAHELFHLAQDIEDLRQTVMDILCSHIRQTTRGKDYQEEYKTDPSEEIQSLLTLLFEKGRDIFEGCSINLKGSHLNRVVIHEARLRKANLMKVQLQSAILTGAKLQWACLEYAHLQNANLQFAHLQNANLDKANLDGANLDNAQLKETGFTKANLQNANLTSAQAQHIHLMRAQLQNAKLNGAQLQRAWLPGAQLQEADLSNAQLQKANINSVQLQEANLSDANLHGAFLYNTQLQGANLSKAQLQGASLIGVRLRETKMEGLQLQGVGGKESDHPSWRDSFEQIMKNRVGKDTDPNAIVWESSKGQQRATKELLEKSGAVTGSYTGEEAEQWIKEYKEATQETDES